MTKRMLNLNKLIKIYNELYNMENLGFAFNKQFDESDFNMIYDRKLESKHLDILTPFYNYKIKQLILDTKSKTYTFIDFDDDLIPYIVIYLHGEDFSIPKDWRHVTIPGVPLYNKGKLYIKLYIKYVNNISINNKTNVAYDNTYTFIINILNGSIITTKEVYIKVMKKVISELNYNNDTRSLTYMDISKRDAIDEFIKYYINNYAYDNKDFKNRLNQYLVLLSQSTDMQHRMKSMHFIVDFESKYRTR